MKVYHYTSGQGLFSILNSQSLQCSNLRFMNDPSEGSYFEQLIDELCSLKDEFKFIHDTLYNKSYRQAVLSPTEKFVASFSKNGDSLSMWNYYSKGNGYNFGIDIQKIMDLNRSTDFSIQQVEINYDKVYQLEQLEELFFKHKEHAQFFNEELERLESDSTEGAHDYFFSKTDGIQEKYIDDLEKLRVGFKHPAYAREEEVRLIISEAPGLKEGERVSFKISSSGVFVSYVCLSLKAPECILDITTHPLNGELHKLGVEEFIRHDPKIRKIQVRASEIPFREV